MPTAGSGGLKVDAIAAAAVVVVIYGGDDVGLVDITAAWRRVWGR